MELENMSSQLKEFFLGLDPKEKESEKSFNQIHD